MAEANQTFIRINKEDTQFTGRVPVGVNGVIAHIPIGEDTPVGEHILSALSDSDIKFTVVSAPAGTGGSESGVGSEPSTTAEHTALQQEPVNEPIYGSGAASSALTEPSALGEVAQGSATGESGDGTGFRDDQANAVEPTAPTGEGATSTGQDGETGSRTEIEGGEPSIPSSEQEGGEPGASAAETPAEPAAEPAAKKPRAKKAS